jgi:hypothetical protein
MSSGMMGHGTTKNSGNSAGATIAMSSKLVVWEASFKAESETWSRGLPFASIDEKS